jgi:ribosomal-protein-alanine N-acetyltransferase
MTSPDTTILETERLILRLLTMDDVDALYPMYSDPETRQYFPEGVLTYEETREEVEYFVERCYAKHGFGLWATIDKATGALIGRCGLLSWNINGKEEVEVAYLLAKDYWGRGLATEAAQGIVRYAFEQLQIPRLICLVDPDNYASQKVAQKLGMHLEFDGDIGDGLRSFVYAMTNPASPLST